MPAGTDQPRESNGEFAYDGGPKKPEPKGRSPGEHVGEKSGGTEKSSPKKETRPTGDTKTDIKTAGGNPELAQNYIAAWRTSGTTKGALQFRAAVSKAAGQDVSKDGERLASRMLEDPKDAASILKGLQSKIGKEQVATVNAMARVSQAHYTEDHVTLYRGISKEQAGELKSSLNSGKGQLRTDQITSFTSSKSVAGNFAKGGAVISIRVPRSSIIASHLSHSELAAEKEVLVASKGGWDVGAGDVEFK